MIKKTTPLFSVLAYRGTGFALFCAALFFGADAHAQTTRFVKPQPAGTADGSSWDNAAGDLQSVLNTSVKGDAIWVAGGTYKPTRKANALTVVTPNDRDNAFMLKDSVSLYGGFAGTEALLTERDLTVTANASILSGDFNGDDTFSYDGDTLSIQNNAENAYHVLIGAGIAGAVIDSVGIETRVDGFTIKGGNANDAALTSLTVNGYAIYRYAGGGLINRIYAAPTFVNVTFIGNNAIYGGGIYNRSYSNMILEDAVVTQNTASLGGGLSNWLNIAPQLTNVVISQNVADAGGGIYNLTNSNPVLTNVEITDNIAKAGSGGGMFNNAATPVLDGVFITDNVSVISGGGMFNTTNSSPLLTVTVTGNSAPIGGGIFNSGNCNPVITNSLISLNEATGTNGGGIYNFQSAPVLSNVEISENTAVAFGGGICNFTNAPAVLTDVVITGNSAAGGAGVFNFDNSAAVLTNVTVSNNQATGNGGGIYNRLGSDAVITNALVTGNTAAYGAGIYNFDNASPVITNATIVANEAVTYGGGIANDNSEIQVRNSILYGNTSATGDNLNIFNFGTSQTTFAYSLVEGAAEGWGPLGIDGGNNTDTDPLFTDAEDGDYTLTAESSLVNHGSNAYFAEGQTPDLSAVVTDLAGNPRMYDGSPIDIGAYEIQVLVGLNDFSALQVTCYPNPVVNYLSIQAQDTVTGVSVYNMLGQEVKSATWNAANNTVDMAATQSGSYIVKVTVGSASKSVMVVKK